MTKTLLSALENSTEALAGEIKLYQNLPDTDGKKQGDLSALSAILSTMTIAQSKLKAGLMLEASELTGLTRNIAGTLTPFIQARQAVIYTALNKGQLSTAPGPSARQAKAESKTVEALQEALLALSAQLAVAEAQAEKTSENPDGTSTLPMKPTFTVSSSLHSKKPSPTESWNDLAEASKKWIEETDGAETGK